MKRTPSRKKPSPIMATATVHKKGVRKNVGKKKSSKVTPGAILKYSFLILLTAFIVAAGYQYRHGFLYYLGFKTNKSIESLSNDERTFANVRNYEIISRNKDKIFGLDVSHYQGDIKWDSIERIKGEFTLDFVFLRSTVGVDPDKKFKSNWHHAKNLGFIRGAYHYYRPDENSLKQANNFIKTVSLGSGDLPPVLDIERISDKQSLDSLKSGVKRWLTAVELHYGVKPILYSGESFYTDYLKKEFKGYYLWIANYSFFEDKIRDEWMFWQFTDKGSVKGVEGNVDINIYNGTLPQLKEILIK
jgi:lysozyme